MWQLNEGKLLLAGLALSSTRETQGRAREGSASLPADRKLFTNSSKPRRREALSWPGAIRIARDSSRSVRMPPAINRGRKEVRHAHLDSADRHHHGSFCGSRSRTDSRRHGTNREVLYALRWVML